MKLLIAADHGGFELKEKIELHYDVTEDVQDAATIDVVDMGPHQLDPADDYPDFAFPLAEELVRVLGETNDPNALETMGILICRSGNGMAIAANKVKGIRAALCFTPEHARKARIDDHANILVLDSDYQDAQNNLAVVNAFVHTQPETGGRHQRRVNKIIDYENK